MSPVRLAETPLPTPETAGPDETVRPEIARGGRVSHIERRLARGLLQAVGNPPIRLVLWNGEDLASGGDHPAGCLTLRDRATLWKLAIDPELQFGEAYSDGRLEVEGDLATFLEALARSRAATKSRDGGMPETVRGLFHRSRRNSRGGSRRNIHQHYDLGNNFYRLWLDSDLVYSGAYFAAPDMTLDEAQRAKLHHVCRKLWLRPGESVVEVGGGWGALALLMARDYGVTVKSFNISRPQLTFARQRAQAEGLASRVEFIEDDYRNIRGRFDVLASLGMLEHVGAAHLGEFGGMMDRCLSPAGRGLIQVIGQNAISHVNPWIERRIFPGAYPPTLRQLTDLFEPWRFSVLDVENLRLHYAKTLRHWLDRFESAADIVAGMFDERFVRMWRLYLAGSCAAFSSGDLQLFQLVFARPQSNAIPLTRARLYAEK